MYRLILPRSRPACVQRSSDATRNQRINLILEWHAYIFRPVNFPGCAEIVRAAHAVVLAQSQACKRLSHRACLKLENFLVFFEYIKATTADNKIQPVVYIWTVK